MDFKDLVLKRYSVRKFSNQPVAQETLETILDAVKFAPSAVNFQPFKIYLFKDGGMLEKVKECYHREWIKKSADCDGVYWNS